MTFRGSLGHSKEGEEGFAEFLISMGNALGKVECFIDEVISESNRVCARFVLSGVRVGDLLLFPATGVSVSWEGVAMITFKSGKIIDIRTLGGDRTLLRQLADASG